MKKIHFVSIDSTNDYLKENYESLDNLTFVSADYQIKGKGRNGRQWFSSIGENLLFSVLIKENIILDNPGLYGVFAAVTISKYLESLGINNVSIKWPNDIYVNGKKICGILSEGRYLGTSLSYVIIGMGLNVNQKSMDENIIHPFTSICLETSKNRQIFKVEDDLCPLLCDMINNINNIKDKYYEYMSSHNYLKNKEVFAEIDGKKALIKVIDVVEGKLKVLKDNKELLLNSGEISFHL